MYFQRATLPKGPNALGDVVILEFLVLPKN